MRKDKNEIIELRKRGESYREIQKITGVSRSTLCDWFKDEEWSKHMKNVNNSKNIILSKDRLKKLDESRKEKFRLLYERSEREAIEEFEIYKKDSLFIAGLMLYAGEGDKKNRNQTRLSNSEFYIHNIFIKFSEKYLKIPREQIRFSLILYPDNNINECINLWGNKVNISVNNFYKTQIISGKEKSKRLQYGIGISIISCVVSVKKKVLKWLELFSIMEF